MKAFFFSKWILLLLLFQAKKQKQLNYRRSKRIIYLSKALTTFSAFFSLHPNLTWPLFLLRFISPRSEITLARMPTRHRAQFISIIITRSLFLSSFFILKNFYWSSTYFFEKIDKQRDRETERQRDRETERQRHRDTGIEKQTERHEERQRKIGRERQRETEITKLN